VATIGPPRTLYVLVAAGRGCGVSTAAVVGSARPQRLRDAGQRERSAARSDRARIKALFFVAPPSAIYQGPDCSADVVEARQSGIAPAP